MTYKYYINSNTGTTEIASKQMGKILPGVNNTSQTSLNAQKQHYRALMALSIRKSPRASHPMAALAYCCRFRRGGSVPRRTEPVSLAATASYDGRRGFTFFTQPLSQDIAVGRIDALVVVFDGFLDVKTVLLPCGTAQGLILLKLFSTAAVVY